MSAKSITKNIFLFDSFEGLSEPSQFDLHKKGKFDDVDYEQIKEYFSQFKNVKINKNIWAQAVIIGRQDRSRIQPGFDEDFNIYAVDELIKVARIKHLLKNIFTMKHFKSIRHTIVVAAVVMLISVVASSCGRGYGCPANNFFADHVKKAAHR